MFIVVAERYRLPPKAVSGGCFSTDAFATRYRNPLFPLPAVVPYGRPLPPLPASHAHDVPQRTLRAPGRVADGGHGRGCFTAFDTQISHAQETRSALRSLQDAEALAVEANPVRPEVRTA